METTRTANAATRNLAGRKTDVDEAAGLAATEILTAIETTDSIDEPRSATDSTEPSSATTGMTVLDYRVSSGSITRTEASCFFKGVGGWDRSAFFTYRGICVNLSDNFRKQY